MNLKDLYDATPVARHGDITVIDGYVYVRNGSGNAIKYVLRPEGELWHVRNDGDLVEAIAEVRALVLSIKKKIGA